MLPYDHAEYPCLAEVEALVSSNLYNQTPREGCCEFGPRPHHRALLYSARHLRSSVRCRSQELIVLVNYDAMGRVDAVCKVDKEVR